MRIEMVFSGFPGKMTTGYMEWSTVVFLETESRRVLFDTGGTGKRVNIVPRLKELGVDPETIDTLVLSHFHSDHIYNFDLFPNAAMYLHEAEASYAEKGGDPWQPPFFFKGIRDTGRLFLLKEGDSLAPGIDVLHLPGHTPGCMGLLLSAPDMPATVIAGDAVKNIAELATGGAAMSLDRKATSNSIRKVRDVAKRVIPGHDRILVVEDDRVLAQTAARETILVPAGVVGPEVRCLELTLEPTWLPMVR